MSLSACCPVRDCGESSTDALCPRHMRAAGVALLELPSYYVQLAMAMVPGATSFGDRITTTRTPGAPINVTARALQEDACQLVRHGELDYRKAKAWPLLRRGGREGQRLTAGAVFLARHMDGVLTMPWGVEMVLDVFRLTRAIRGTLQLDRLVHKLPVPCPNCDSMAMEREDGQERTRCRNCGREFTEDEYAHLVLLLASMAK